MKTTKQPNTGRNYPCLACICILGLLAVFSHGMASAISQTADKKTTSLSLVLQKILSHNPELKGFEFLNQHWQNLQAHANQAPGMTLGIEGDNVFGTDSYAGFSQAEVTLSLRSIIERGNQRGLRSLDIESNHKLSQIEQSLQTLNLMAEATQMYIDILAVQAQMKLTQETVTFNQKILSWLKKGAKQGITNPTHLLQAEAAILQAQIKIQQLEATHQSGSIALATLWGQESPDFESLSGDLFSFEPTPPLEVLLEMVSRSPHAEQLTQMSRLKQIELNAIQAESRTNIEWQIGISRLQGSQDMALSAGIAIPLFNKKRNQGRVLAAQAKQQQLALSQSQRLRLLKGHLRQTHINSEMTRLQAKTLQNEVIPLLKKALKHAEDGFRRGGISYQELISSQQQLLEAESQLITSATNTLRLQTTIEQLTAALLNHDRNPS